MIHVVVDRYFSLFLRGLKIFLNPRLSLTVPLNAGPTGNPFIAQRIMVHNETSS